MAAPYDGGGFPDAFDDEEYLAVAVLEGALLTAYAFELDGREVSDDGVGCHDGIGAARGLGALVQGDAYDGGQVLWPVAPVLALDAQHRCVDEVGLGALAVEVELYDGAEAEHERVGGDGAPRVAASGTKDGGVVHAYAAELAALRVELGKAVEPKG